MTSRRKPRRKRNGRRRRMVRQDKQILTEFMAAKRERGMMREEEEGGAGGKGILCVATRRGLLAAFLPPWIYHPLSYARLRWRCERLSWRRFSLSETGNRGPPLSRVCKTASGNAVRRRKPLRAMRTPWNIVKRLGTPFLSYLPLPLRSSTSDDHPLRAFLNTSHRRSSFCCNSLPLSLLPFRPSSRKNIHSHRRDNAYCADDNGRHAPCQISKYRVDISSLVFNDKQTS